MIYCEACGDQIKSIDDIAVVLVEAKRYMEYQKHNLTRPRTYTVSGGYSNNGEYEPFWNLLMAAGQKLLKENQSIDPEAPNEKNI